ncbi:MAG TPA: HAMP domain-containing sensor histidine kinase, partial [Acidimicrobiia bacterium]|nr:HAMP domain-containing sensor histidine kinase [Acidimicrobiia bacterium]
MPRGEPRRHRALGLRRRGTIAFAALALLVSASMAILTYQIARTYLVDKRESLALRQAALNARAVQEVLRARDPDVQDLMAGLPTSSTSHPVLRIGGEWYAAAVSFGQDIVPSALLQMTEDDRAGRQLTTANGEPVLVVGVPIAGTDAVYFEAFSLTELERTLATLRNSLLIAAAITTVIGAFLGSYLNRRALKPLRTFADGAAGLARGRLETRLAAPGDPDLAPVAAAFNDMAAALQDRIEREARFASDVTHELRTPLTALSAAVEVLDRRADERMRPAVDVVQAQVQHFERLVLDLLEISRYDAGAAELTTEAVDVARFFHSLTDSLDAEGVSLVIDPSTPKTFDLDKRRVERALANLLENAH